MKFSTRLALAVLIVVFDFVTFAVPLAACYAAFVIVMRPASFLGFVLRLYDEGGSPAKASG
jgi:hypothetical protein